MANNYAALNAHYISPEVPEMAFPGPDVKREHPRSGAGSAGTKYIYVPLEQLSTPFFQMIAYGTHILEVAGADHRDSPNVWGIPI
jgi:hypothetical protein